MKLQTLKRSGKFYLIIDVLVGFKYRLKGLISLLCTAGIDDLFEVLTELLPVTARWRQVGLALRLNPGQLKRIEKENRGLEDCLTEMLTLWLEKNYNSDRFGEPSWKLLAAAVGHPAGGKDCALAEEIIKTHRGIMFLQGWLM